MWLPVFIAQNIPLMRELEAEMRKTWMGMSVDEVGLLKIHMWTIRWLCEKFKIEGLDKYLNALSAIEEK
jgi:hypothetical protein